MNTSSLNRNRYDLTKDNIAYLQKASK